MRYSATLPISLQREEIPVSTPLATFERGVKGRLKAILLRGQDTYTIMLQYLALDDSGIWEIDRSLTLRASEFTWIAEVARTAEFLESRMPQSDA